MEQQLLKATPGEWDRQDLCPCGSCVLTYTRLPDQPLATLTAQTSAHKFSLRNTWAGLSSNVTFSKRSSFTTLSKLHSSHLFLSLTLLSLIALKIMLSFFLHHHISSMGGSDIPSRYTWHWVSIQQIVVAWMDYQSFLKSIFLWLPSLTVFATASSLVPLSPFLGSSNLCSTRKPD